MRSVDRGFTRGVTIRIIRGHGRIIKCMERGICGGLMGKNILETSVKIRDMDSVNSDGEMVVSTKASG